MSRGERAAAVFAALGDETRLRLVERLGTGKALSIATLTDGSGLTRQAVTKHLRVLHAAGLARGVRRGREHLWAPAPARLREAQAYIDAVSARWDRAIARLRRLVEE